jgi:hypothetical protein
MRHLYLEIDTVRSFPGATTLSCDVNGVPRCSVMDATCPDLPCLRLFFLHCHSAFCLTSAIRSAAALDTSNGRVHVPGLGL